MNVRVGPADVDSFRSIVAWRLGLSLDCLNPAQLADVLATRVAAAGRSCAAYLGELSAGGSQSELDALAAALTVAETYFFRNVEQFQALADVVVPQRLRARALTRRLSLLSMACATGEEAYTLAMVVRAAVADPTWTISVVGVDINSAALRTAERGRYPQWSLRATPPAMLRSWLRPDGGALLVDDEIRAMVRFVRGNLVDADDDAAWLSPDGYDAVFCRNAIMYLTPRHAGAAVARLVGALAPDGFLFLGHAETGLGRSPGLEVRHTHEAFYYQRVTPSAEPATHGAGTAATGPIDAGVATASRAPRQPIRAAPAPVAARKPPAPLPAPSPDERLLTLIRQERFAEALALHEARLTAHDTGGPDVVLLHAVLLAQRGRLDLAEDACRQVLGVDGSNAGAHYLLAVCREDAGDWPAMVAHARTAAHLDPGFALPHLRLGLWARRRGDAGTARHELGSALTLLAGEDPHRLLLFGGGFTRAALIALCRHELRGCGSAA